jgi:hypothetical protein
MGIIVWALGLSWADDPIQVTLAKEPATGRIVGHASAHLPQPIDAVWPVLQGAIHGRLSESTVVCVFVPEASATAALTAMPTQRLPLADVSEATWFEQMLHVGTQRNTPVAPGGHGQRHALRQLDVPIPLVADRWFLARETYDARSSGRYLLRIEGIAGNISHYDATWTLSATSSGTDVSVNIASDLGFSVPAAFVGLGVGELRTSIERLTRLAATEIR